MEIEPKQKKSPITQSTVSQIQMKYVANADIPSINDNVKLDGLLIVAGNPEINSRQSAADTNIS